MDMEKKYYRRITVAEMAPHVHSFQSGEDKAKKIYNWLANWITLSLECGKIHPFDLLPLKADLACHICVSQGTVQNAFRMLEDDGYVESKQRIGTYIKDLKSGKEIEKLTSKRELAIEIVKKYLSENGYQKGDTLVSARQLSRIIGISNTTLRLAVSHLVRIGILLQKDGNYIVNCTDYDIKQIEIKTLVEKIADLMREYIKENYKPGDKLPANSRLTQHFNVSIKTIHDAIKLLTKEGLLYSRRGKYGTVVLGECDENIANAYYYEKIEQKIRQYISANCKVGDKLPSIRDLSERYNVSGKTIKKALDLMAEDGFLTFVRGRYGGTFVTDIPEGGGMAYKWLALSNNYITEIEN